MGTPWYTTRERVKEALDSGDSARNNKKVDRACRSATESVDTLCGRYFWPHVGTFYFDWPSQASPSLYRLWVPDLISLTSLTSGGVTISASDYFLYPSNAPARGEPYRWIEIDRSNLGTFAAGDTAQRNIAVTGTWGYPGSTEPAGTLAAAIVDTTSTEVAVSDSAAIGIGDLIKVDTEYMIVTSKSLLTTGQTVQVAMTATASGTTCAVTDGTVFVEGETIAVDSERMLVEDIAGNSLIVRRAYDGSTLAAHDGSTIYVPRTLTVERGACGSTAATHLLTATVSRYLVPGPVATLATAEALNILISDSSGWARNPGEGVSSRPASGVGLPQLRKQVEDGYASVTYRGAI